MDAIFQALGTAFSLPVLLYMAGGVAVGVTAGAIPGISGTTAIALAIPLMYKLNPSAALGFLIGIYKGSMFGGSISAISFGVPGTPAAAATVFDGAPAKKKGKPKQALLTALYSSVTGDVTSDLILIFLAVPMANIALKFGPTEFFALYIFSLMLIALLTEGNLAKGLAMAALGLVLGCVGSDPVSGAARFNFGITELRGGIKMVPLLVGIFAMSELITQLYAEWHKLRDAKIQEIVQKAEEIEGYDPKKDKMTWKIYKSTLKATFIGAGIGTMVGALPGAGSSLAAFMSYSLARRFSKHPEEFGNGSLEGVAAPEAGNSATCGATFIPLFAFGIPGSSTAALFGVALMMQGVSLGPLMIKENTHLMYTFFIVMIFANVVNLFLSRALIPLYAKISMLQTRFLVPTVIVLALIGGYASQNSTFDVILLLVFSFLGVYLKKHNYPTGPLVLGYIIGPGAERALSQALSINKGNWLALFQSPIAIALYIGAVIFIVALNITFKKTATAMTGKEGQ